MYSVLRRVDTSQDGVLVRQENKCFTGVFLDVFISTINSSLTILFAHVALALLRIMSA